MSRKRKNWRSKDYTKLKQKWKLKIGRRKIQMLLFMRSIRSSSPNDCSYSRLFNVLIRLKETK